MPLRMDKNKFYTIICIITILYLFPLTKLIVITFIIYAKTSFEQQTIF